MAASFRHPANRISSVAHLERGRGRVYGPTVYTYVMRPGCVGISRAGPGRGAREALAGELNPSAALEAAAG